jgi:hypothetical protein
MTYGGNKAHCCGGNSNCCNNNNDTMPIYLDEAILHRIAFTVWHTALHLEREQVCDDVMMGTFAVGFSQHSLAVKETEKGRGL